jgi:hypothetical protein
LNVVATASRIPTREETGKLAVSCEEIILLLSRNDSSPSSASVRITTI